MKTKEVIFVVALMCAAVSTWLGCHRGSSSKDRPPREVSLPPGSSDKGWEYKTVEKRISPDPEQRVEELKQQMQEFDREGWLVLSISKPLPQPDGTIRRKFELKTAKK